MAYTIDLKELAARESEKVEWKENGDDKEVVKSLVKTISAFANDISNFGGGYVVCGAKENRDEYGFPKLQYVGLSANKLKEIEAKVLQYCRDYVSPSVVPIVQELENPNDENTRILVFIVLATSEAHTFRDGEKTTYYVRISRETREARNGILAQLLIKKQKLDYFDKRVCPSATEHDIDILLFRDCIQEMGLLYPNKPLEDYLSDKEQIAEFVPPLFVRSGLDEVLRPRNFTLLMFGKKSSISLRFPDCHVVLSVYSSTDRSEPVAERHIFSGSIIEQARRAVELMNVHAYTAFDKTNIKPNQVKYPIRALQEAVINAIVHRNYEIPEPIRITVFSDRIEIMSPGELHWGVDKEKFLMGKASPKWRNQSFAYLFNKLQLAQFEGQGLPTIFRTMKEEGCPSPTFEIGAESITCILPAHPRHRIVREIQEIQDKIILGKLDDAKQQVLSLLEKDLYNFRTIDLFCEISAKQNKPEDVYDFITTKNIDYYTLNPNTLVNIAEVLALKKVNKNHEVLVNRILSIALNGKIEETQAVKAVVSLKKVGDAEEVIKFIGELFAKYPSLVNKSVLYEKRATAKMDVAKKCQKTLNDIKSSSKIKERAKEMYRQLLNEAELDLSRALELADNASERAFIESDLVFLNNMKSAYDKAKKP